MLVCSLQRERSQDRTCAAAKVSVLLRKSLKYAALVTGCTLTAVSRSTQLSTLRGTVNEYQPYG